MKKEPIWTVGFVEMGELFVCAVGNCDEIAIYLYSERLEHPHSKFQLQKWENINKCTQVIEGEDYQNWDRFLDAFEVGECTEEQKTEDIVSSVSAEYKDNGFFGWNKN